MEKVFYPLNLRGCCAVCWGLVPVWRREGITIVVARKTTHFLVFEWPCWPLLSKQQAHMILFYQCIWYRNTVGPHCSLLQSFLQNSRFVQPFILLSTTGTLTFVPAEQWIEKSGFEPLPRSLFIHDTNICVTFHVNNWVQHNKCLILIL